MEAVVFGNVTLDIICRTVDEVPRYDSIAFEHAGVSPGGCGSNVAIGLRACGIDTALVASIGEDDAGFLARRYWQRLGIDLRYVSTINARTTGVSVALVDSRAQPRFVHTSGANALLNVDALRLEEIAALGGRALHVAGFFVLPGLLDGRLPDALRRARALGLHTSLDVVRSPRMKDPSFLWPCVPHLDVFLCNAEEARILTGEGEPEAAARIFHSYGCRASVIKLGAQGCWLEADHCSALVPSRPVDVVDTTGAGDAFDAGLISALLRGNDLLEACREGNEAGARAVGGMGALHAWSAQISSAAA